MKNRIIGSCLMIGNSFLSGLILATMFPNPNYDANWGKFALCAMFVVVGAVSVLADNKYGGNDRG